MKILIISDLYPKNDKDTSGTFVRSQVVELNKMGVDFRVLRPVPKFKSYKNILSDMKNATNPAKEYSMDGVSITSLPYWNVPLRFSVRFVAYSLHSTLMKYINIIKHEYPFDLIHAHRVFPNGYVAMLLSQKLGIPVVVTAHGSDIHTHPGRNSEIAKYTKKTIENADQIVAVSTSLARQMNEMAQPQEYIKVIYTGINGNDFKPREEDKVFLRKKLDLPENGIGICTVCRLVKEKGLVELLKAFEDISSRHSNVWLTIVGDGPARNMLEKWVQKRDIKKKVIFVGPHPHKEVADWMNATDIFTLPSYNEGLGNVFLEAMACAKPVVATRVGAIPEVVVDEITGFLIPSRQVSPIVDALDRLIQNDELRHKMGIAGYERVRTKFLWPEYVRSQIKIYKKLVVNS